MTQNDYEILKEQLGRTPGGILDIPVRDLDKRPVVLMVDPLLGGRPFPTLYWLSHKTLHKEISKIESRGFIKHLEKTILPLREDIQQQLLQDTRQYQRKRWSLLASFHDLESVSGPYKKQLQTTGIGGLKDFTKIKCLHLHYAHYLAHRNIIGRIMEEEFHLSRFIK